jgi:hypothetical protein
MLFAIETERVTQTVRPSRGLAGGRAVRQAADDHLIAPHKVASLRWCVTDTTTRPLSRYCFHHLWGCMSRYQSGLGWSFVSSSQESSAW